MLKLVCLFMIFSLPFIYGISRPTSAGLTATMNGEQAGSGSASTGAGVLFYDAQTKLLSVRITHNVNNPISASIHSPAKPGQTGPITIKFTAASNPIEESVKIPDSVALDILHGNAYVAIYTNNNLNGEIRGQIQLQSLQSVFSGDFKLEGESQVPPVDTKASGKGSFQYFNVTGLLKFSISHDIKSQNVTGAHIHGPAAANQTAGVLVAFESPISPIKGELNLNDVGGLNLAAFQDSFASELLYVNIHSTAHPGGEIRGQLRFTDVSLDQAGNGDDGYSGGEIFGIILAVLIALAVVVVGGFFLYKKYHDTAPVPRKSGYARAGKDGLGASLMDDAQQVEIGSSHP